MTTKIVWLLVYIVADPSGSVSLQGLAQYGKMSECFAARHRLLVYTGAEGDYFPVGQQALCMQAKVDK